MATPRVAPLHTDDEASVSDPRAGLVIRFAGTLRFLPLRSVLLVAAEPPITTVPGTSLGVTLVGEYVTSVLRLGPTTGQVIVCDVGGEPVSLSGVEVLETGKFEPTNGGVRYADAAVPVLDVADLLRRPDRGADPSVGR